MTSPVLASFLVYLDLRVLSLASIKLMYVTVKQIFISTERCGSLTGYEYLAPISLFELCHMDLFGGCFGGFPATGGAISSEAT